MATKRSLIEFALKLSAPILGLTACAIAPRLPIEEGELSIQHVVDAVQCELTLARSELSERDPLRDWDAGFTLDSRP